MKNEKATQRMEKFSMSACAFKDVLCEPAFILLHIVHILRSLISVCLSVSYLLGVGD